MKDELERIRDQLKCSLNMGGLKGSAEWAVAELDRLASLPIAGLAVEEAEVVAWVYTDTSPEEYLRTKPFVIFSRPDGAAPGPVTHENQQREPLMTVAQHNRIVAAYQEWVDARGRAMTGLEQIKDAEIEHLRAALSAQQSAPERVSVPVELLETAVDVLESAEERSTAAELRALLASHQQAPHSNGVEPNELREAVKRFRDGNNSHQRGEA